MRKIKLLFLAVTVFFLVIVAVAMAVPQLTPLAPTFQTRTRLVQVDVIVRNKNGPVTMLSQDDFTLLDNGKPQKISVFAVKGTLSSRQPAVPLPPGTVSNRVTRNGQEAASATILLLDGINTSPGDQGYAKRKMVKFLENRHSQDRIGVYEIGNGLRVVQDLTDDPDRLGRAINNLKPQIANHVTFYTPGSMERVGPDLSANAMEDFTLSTMNQRVIATRKALEAIAHHLAPVPGRKSLIWITGGFPTLFQTAHASMDFFQDLKEAARALNDANVALYAVDARGLTARGLLLPGIDTMNNIAGLTGGRAFYADNGLDSLMEESVEDSELIYTLGFYPSQETQNGDWHKLKVLVDRHGVNVRYREAYFASKTATDAERHLTLEQMLGNSLDAAQIGLRAETKPDQARPGVYQLRATVDLHDVHLEHQDMRWVGGVEVSLYLEGTPSAYKISRKIAIPEDQLATALDTGIVVEVAFGVPRSGDLRVVVQDDATGAGGSVRVPLEKK